MNFWKPKLYWVEIKCNHCTICNWEQSTFSTCVDKGTTIIGQEVECHNCGIKGEVIVGKGRDGSNRLYLDTYKVKK